MKTDFQGNTYRTTAAMVDAIASATLRECETAGLSDERCAELAIERFRLADKDPGGYGSDTFMEARAFDRDDLIAAFAYLRVLEVF